jgi:hypothetical protein
MAMNTTLPKAMPKLTADKMCKGSYSMADGRRCLVGWQFSLPSSCIESVYDALLREAKLFDPKFPHAPLSVFNDSHTESENADVWNRTMIALGYIERDGQFVLSAAGRDR